MATQPNKSVLDSVLEALAAAAQTGDTSKCQAAHDELEQARDQLTAIDLEIDMLEVSPTGDDYNNVMSILGVIA